MCAEPCRSHISDQAPVRTWSPDTLTDVATCRLTHPTYAAPGELGSHISDQATLRTWSLDTLTDLATCLLTTRTYSAPGDRQGRYRNTWELGSHISDQAPVRTWSPDTLYFQGRVPLTLTTAYSMHCRPFSIACCLPSDALGGPWNVDDLVCSGQG